MNTLKSKFNLLVWNISLILNLTGCTKTDSLLISGTQCNHLADPIGINTLEPSFSWKNSSSRHEAAQTAYQLLVASELSGLTENKANLWNSGKVESDASLFIPYQGQKLSSGTAAWWKVRVWDEAGNVSAWSEPARFSVGLLDESDWQASYIAFNTENAYRDCPQLYATFEVHETDKNYFLHVNSLGYHEIVINGERVDTGPLTPAVSQFDKRSLINTYEASSLLKEGKNNIIVWLGSGWYTEGLPGVVNNGPVVRAQLEKVENNQREIILTTDENWQGRKSSYTRHGNWRPHRFGGEIVDGALAENDLKIDNPENPWSPVSLIDIPTHQASPQMTEQNAVTETISPISIKEMAPDTFLIDMGKNLTGWIEVHFSNLQKSQEIKLDYCDHLINGEQFNDQNQWDMYIASGNSPETFINKFNYHGFRYVRITGLKEKPLAESVKAYLIQTDFEPAATFECSDPDLNRIHDMVNYTLRCLSLGGYLVDCPQLERLGYGGDGNASTVTAQTMFNMAPLYHNWLQAWADVIRENGSMPHTAPNPYRAGGGPYWCGFIISASWNTYQNYGDAGILEKYYPVMQKWLEYVAEYTVDGLLKQWPNTDYRNWYLGDWATPEGIDQTNENSVDLVNNCYISVCFDQMSKIAGVLGKPENSEEYLEKKEQLNRKIHEVFFDASKGYYGTGSQIDFVFPMLAGAVPENLTDDITGTLIRHTENNHHGHLATGLVGIPVMMEWAVEANQPDFIYSMLKKKSYPGYLYMLENGATTTWEHWDGARSRIHNCYNGVGQWFYQAVGGIRAIDGEPAYREFLIHPQIPDGITWAKTQLESPQGTITVNWDLSADAMKMEIKVPVGSTAKLCRPEGATTVKINYKAATVSDTIPLQSGNYLVEYSLSN